jgi:sugar lactone lactonase YvrE
MPPTVTLTSPMLIARLRNGAVASLIALVAACGGGGGDTILQAPAAPAVTMQPSDATVHAPATASFGVAAAGVPTPTIQWQQSLDGGATWTNIAGATTESYTTPTTALGDSGKQLRAVFSNASGGATTNAATLIVAPNVPTVSLLAGDIGGRGNFDGTGSATRFNDPAGVAVDPSGNTYVADSASNRIRRVTPSGVVSTVAGSGVFDFADGVGLSAAFASPQAIAIDSSGVLYVADTQSSTIRKVMPDGTVTTVAGLAFTTGTADGLGATARFNAPSGIAVDASGTLYVSDTGNGTIRKISSAGLVSTLVGPPPFGVGFKPAGLAVNGSGTVFVADRAVSNIKTVSSSGAVSNLAATVVAADGSISPATFNQPFGLSVDPAGNLYVADRLNNAIRKIDPSGVTTTIAGVQGVRGNADGTGASALFYGPRGVAIDATGLLHVADTSNQTIRTITSAGVVTTVAGLAENTGAVDGDATTARFGRLAGLVMGPSGSYFVADPTAFAVRKVSSAGMVSTFAGSIGMNGAGDVSDNGTGGSARFSFGTPSAIAADPLANLYVNDVTRIRKISAGANVGEFVGSSVAVGTADGTGALALFYSIQGLASDGIGNILVADGGAVRKVSPGGVVTTLAGIADQTGNVDGTGSAARFFSLSGITVDPSGIIYVADSINRTIRKVTAAGVVTTLAGNPTASGAADGTGTTASFLAPTAIAADGNGSLYVADACAIRKVSAAGVVTTVVGVIQSCGIRLGSNGLVYTPRGIVVVNSHRLALVSLDAVLIADLP